MINPVCSRPALAEKQKTKQNGVQYNWCQCRSFCNVGWKCHQVAFCICVYVFRHTWSVEATVYI